ncbi:Endolytic murein transglycosylase [Candidatus Xenohaliotis californiensis]|uniref:Endolytic murein transglycosylase n=1 Tax=Candidatus Xenohaliotis californiensis TaxID=84677 RepID=A0ABM9N975_9RICK|nr:Endolytic murein transglycosylase [Candidatus Xenohaliotis californiensis]
MKIIFVFILLIAVCSTLLSFTIMLNSGSNEIKEMVIVDPGDTLRKIASNLVEKHIIRNKTTFMIVTYILQKQHLLKPGKYVMQSNNILKIIQSLSERDALVHKITIPEGLTTYQILDILQKKEELFGTLSKDINEGELYPSTYYIRHGDNINSLVNAMKQQMYNTAEKLWHERNMSIPIANKKDAIILASIIEKEAANNDEKSEISGVFINRLYKKMKLQSDPTVIYALTNGRWDLNRTLTKKDLQIPSEYNTYYISALPPAPITNPGYESIKAALHPSKTDNLYFVSDDGCHIFSKTLKEHNAIRRKIKLKNIEQAAG